MRRILLVPAIVFAGTVALATLPTVLVSAAEVSVFGQSPSGGPVTWQIHAGAEADGTSLQAMAFYPTDIFVNAGDTITWHFDGAEPHTVTFVPKGQTPPGLNAPPSPDKSTFDGSTVVNSGLLTGPGATYSVTFSAPGDYTYLCLLHQTTMSARVHVNPAGSPYPHTQADYDRQAKGQSGLAIQDGHDIVQATRDAAKAAGAPNVIAGGGDGQIFFAAFQPQQQRVTVGQTVVWTNPDSITPHTVTFGASSTATAGLDSPGHATISANPPPEISSGLIGVRRTNGSDFSVTFNAPGTYTYICSLHSALGMTGTIVVSPAKP